MFTTPPTSRAAATAAVSPEDPPVTGKDKCALPDGTWLDEFRIIRTLGAGGFGIVYLALDTALQREVAIKEYLPMSVAQRGSGTSVELRSAPAAFAAGLASFLYEARLLASFDHPSLVKVHRFWEANNTAYMAMCYCPGRTLKDERSQFAAAPAESWLRGIILPLLDALELLHEAGVYHRDISPDNIVLLADGTPVLLDFGSARRVIGDRTQALTAILKPNFAPIEQYADVPGMRQGPWTDLYALGAVVHFMLTGQAPVPSVMRTLDDTLPKLCAAEAQTYRAIGPVFLAAIDWALQVAPNARPQSVAALREALGGASAAAPQPRVGPFAMVAPGAADAPQTDSSAWVLTSSVAPVGRAILPADVLSAANNQAALECSATEDAASGPRRSRKLTLAVMEALGTCVVALVVHGGLPAAPGSAHEAAGSAPPTSTLVAVGAVAVGAAVAGAAVAEVAVAEVAVAEVAVAEVAPARVPAPTATPSAAIVTAPVGERRSAVGDAPSHPRSTGQRSAASPTKRAQPERTASEDAGPRSACGDRNFLAISACVRRECSTPRFRAHSECLRLQREEDSRLQKELSSG